jgi:hypothetical protein
MRSFNNMLCEVNDTVTEYVNDNLEQIRADKAGLDARCGRIWVCLDCIAVEKGNDRTLDYYGGFEYVDKEYRTNLGDWVFYSAEDERVAGHLAEYYSTQEEEF